MNLIKKKNSTLLLFVQYICLLSRTCADTENPRTGLLSACQDVPRDSAAKL